MQIIFTKDQIMWIGGLLGSTGN